MSTPPTAGSPVPQPMDHVDRQSHLIGLAKPVYMALKDMGHMNHAERLIQWTNEYNFGQMETIVKEQKKNRDPNQEPEQQAAILLHERSALMSCIAALQRARGEEQEESEPTSLVSLLTQSEKVMFGLPSDDSAENSGSGLVAVPLIQLVDKGTSTKGDQQGSKESPEDQIHRLQILNQSYEQEIARLTHENTALSVKLTQAEDNAKNIHGSIENATNNATKAEDAIANLHDLSRLGAQSQAIAVEEKFRRLDNLISQQSAQIYRLEVDLEDRNLLEEENQQLKAALKKDSKITVGSKMDEQTKDWVIRARDETLQLERDLDLLEEQWYGYAESGNAATQPSTAQFPPYVQDRNSRSQSAVASSRQSLNASQLQDFQNLAEQFAQQGSLPAGDFWRNSQSFARPGSSKSYASGHLSNVNSRPTSRYGRPQSGSHASSSRRSTNAAQQMARNLADRRNYYSLIYPGSKGSIPIPAAAEYTAGMNSNDFADAVAQSSMQSLDYHRQDGLKTIVEEATNVRPLHYGRKASFGTISERSHSGDHTRAIASINKPPPKSPHLEVEALHTTLDHPTSPDLRVDHTNQTVALIVMDQGTQTEKLKPTDLTPAATSHQSTQTILNVGTTAMVDKETATMSPTQNDQDQDTAVDPRKAPQPDTRRPVSVYDKDTQTTGENSTSLHLNGKKFAKHLQFTADNKATRTIFRDSSDAKDGRDTAMAPERTTFGYAEVQTIFHQTPLTEATVSSTARSTAMTPKQTAFGYKADQTEIDQAPLTQVSVFHSDKATAMTPGLQTFEYQSVETQASIPFKGVEQGIQTDIKNVAELPAGLLTAPGIRQASPSALVHVRQTPKVPRSRVAAAAGRIEKDSQKQGRSVKLAVTASIDGTSAAHSGSAKTTTPTKLITRGPDLPFARAGDLTKFMQKAPAAKTEREMQQASEASVQPGTDPYLSNNELLPAIAYKEPSILVRPDPQPIRHFGVQTSPVEADSAQIIPSRAISPAGSYPNSDRPFNAASISPEATVVSWETPDDDPYPTPSFYSNPWQSSASKSYSDLEVVQGESLDDSDKVLLVTGDEDSLVSSSNVDTEKADISVPEDFARTALPSPDEQVDDMESENSDKVDSAMVEQVEDEAQTNEAPKGLKELKESSEQSASEIRANDHPELLVRTEGNQNAPISAGKVSRSPVSPEDAQELRLVRYGDPSLKPSPESLPKTTQLETRGKLVGLGINLALHEPDSAGTTPFPAYHEQLSESPAQYSDDPPLSEQSSVESTPLIGLRNGLTLHPRALGLSNVIDEDDEYDEEQAYHRASSLAALEGRTEQEGEPYNALDLPPISPPESFDKARNSCQPPPLRFGVNRLPRPEPQSELQHSSAVEIGTTSPIEPESTQVEFPEASQSTRQVERKRKPTSAPVMTTPFIAGLLGWRRSTEQQSTTTGGMIEQPAQEPVQGTGVTPQQPAEPIRQVQSTDTGTNTPTLPGAFSDPRAFEAKNFANITLPFLPMVLAGNMIQGWAKINSRVRLEWRKLMWLALWVAILAYFIYNMWLATVLRDHINEWKSANVSPRKYSYIVAARDEYWGNSWLRLFQFSIAGGFGGSRELFV